MLTLHTSNHTERLVETLVRNLRRPFNDVGDLFQTQHVVVPNANTRAYLQFAIAQHLGIAANLNFTYLTRLLAHLTRDLERRDPDGGTLQAALLRLVGDPGVLERAELEPVRRYLEVAGDDPELLLLRRFQLAREVTGLLARYRIDRPDMVAAWLLGQHTLPESERETEAWQASLYRDLFGADGILADRPDEEGPRWVAMADVFKAFSNEELDLPAEVHVFGLSYTSTDVLDVLTALGSRAQVHVYLLHPCKEVATSSGPAPWALNRSNQAGLAAMQAELKAESSPLLQLWAAPLRLHYRLLASEGGCTLRSDFVAPYEVRQTLLSRVQQDLLDRVPESVARERASMPLDDSLQVLACPSIVRELEAIVCTIWELVDRSRKTPGVRPLNFHEIALVVVHGNKDAYLTRVDSVFNAAHNLPRNIVDLRPESSSRYVEALTLLLSLPFGELHREDLLALMTHPCVGGRWDDFDPKLWETWCADLGIVHGASHAEHLDTYLDADTLNWDQGVRRLVQGAFMAGARSSETLVVEVGGEHYVPHETANEHLGAVGRFAVLVRALIADAAALRETRCSLTEWSQLLVDLAEHYLVSSRDDSLPGRCRRVFRELEEADLGDAEVPYRVVYEWVRAGLSGVEVERGQYLSEGVVVSSFLPLRPIPFRAVFIAGLGEGQFPTQSSTNALDLRALAPRPTDVVPREAERILFLETLLLAREHLFLSYVAQDAQTGDTLQPSAVVDELLSVLERSTGVKRDPLTVRIPLRRHDGRAFAKVGLATHRHLPAAMVEREVAVQRAALHALWPKDAPLPASRVEVEAVLDEPARDALRAQLRFPSPPLRPEAERKERVELSTTALRKFLECPVQAGAKYLLNLWEHDEDDVYAKLDEDFQLERLEQILFLNGIFAELVATADSWNTETVHAAHLEVRQRLGKGPYGVFAEGTSLQNLNILRLWGEGLKAAKVDTLRPYSVLRFGRAERGSQAEATFPSLTLQVPIAGAGPEAFTTVELYGTTAFLDAHREVFIVPKTAGSPQFKPEYWLGPYIDHLVLTASGEGEFPRRMVLCGTRSMASGTFPAFTKNEARECLISLLGELFDGVHDGLLPIDVIYAAQKKYFKDNPPGSLEEFVRQAIIEKVDDHAESPNFNWLVSMYGPIRPLTRLPVPQPEKIREVIDGRLSTVLNMAVQGSGVV